MVSASKMVQSGYRLIQYLLLCFFWQLGAVDLGWSQHSSMGLHEENSERRLGEWRWATDDIAPTDDKQVHAVGSFVLYYLLVTKEVHPYKAIAVVSSLGIAKECMDALVPWEIYGRMGGDGFSKYDLFYNSLGLFVAYAVDDKWSIRYSSGYVSIIYRP